VYVNDVDVVPVSTLKNERFAKLQSLSACLSVNELSGSTQFV